MRKVTLSMYSLALIFYSVLIFYVTKVVSSYFIIFVNPEGVLNNLEFISWLSSIVLCCMSTYHIIQYTIRYFKNVTKKKRR